MNRIIKIFVVVTLAALVLAAPLVDTSARPLASSITPTLGSELIQNGNFEGSFSSGRGQYWQVSAGSPAFYQETTIIHGGSNSQKIVADSGGGYQAPTNILGQWYEASGWMYVSGGSSKIQWAYNAARLWPSASSIIATTNAWTQYFHTGRSSTGTVDGPGCYSNGTGSTFYCDDFSFKSISLVSMFGDLNSVSGGDVTVSANWTSIAGTQSGVVSALNSSSNPSCFIIAYIDGTNLYADKVINGTYTNLINSAINYIAGNTISIGRTNSIFRVYYNGSQIAGDQSITDVCLGDLYGTFSAYSGNTYTGFTIINAATATPTIAATAIPTSTPAFIPARIYISDKVSPGEYSMVAMFSCIGMLLLVWFIVWLILRTQKRRE